MGIMAWAMMPASALAKSDPLSLLQRTAHGLTEQLINDHSLIESQDHYLEQMIDDRLAPVIDYHYMCRKALGKYWKRMSLTQKQEFEQAFKRKLIRTYSHAFKAYSGQSVHFSPASIQQDNTDRAFVSSHLKGGSGQNVNLDYRLHHQDGRWQVYDILINGGSLVTTFSDQIQHLINEYGVGRAISKLTREYPDNRRVITLGADNWAPYASENLPDQGLAVAIVSKALERLGYRVDIQFSPWKKLVEQVSTGELDGLLATWPNQTPDSFQLSKPYLESELRF